MSCTNVALELPLYVYGELSQEEEERLEGHLATCEGCSAELERVRVLSRELSAAEAPVSEELLNRCRVDLDRTLRQERAAKAIPRQSWLGHLRDLMHLHIGFRIPAGALALIAVGFIAGKFAPLGFAPLGMGSATGSQQAGIVSVRSVEPDATGKVRIAFDNVSQKTISGSPDDPAIRALLLASLKDQSNPGVRVETTGIMKDHAADADVRSALLDAVQHDPNVGVRINAVEGLKQYGGEPDVRKAMTQVLLNDVNPGVRMKAIDLLTAHKDQSIVGPLQNAMQKEDNSYVRMRMTDALREMNASLGNF
jgi:hypothetical protein